MSLLIASISITILIIAFNLMMNSKRILENKEKLKVIGEWLVGRWLIGLWLVILAAGMISIIGSIYRSDMRNTYIGVGVSLIAASFNALVVGKILKEPDSDHKRLGKIVLCLSRGLGFLAFIAMITAIILAWYGN